MWKRAVWREGNYEEEGVVPAIWIKAGTLFWPPGANAEKAFNEKRKPTNKWRQFPLVKIKHSSDKFKDCDQYNQTTSAESSDEDEQPARRKSAKRKYDGLVSIHSMNDSEEDSFNQNVPGSSEKQKWPTPPKKFSRAGHQSQISPKKTKTGKTNYYDRVHNITQQQGDPKSDENCAAMLNETDEGTSKSQLQDESTGKKATVSTGNDNQTISTSNKIKTSAAQEKSSQNRNKSSMKKMSISAQTSRTMSQEQSRSRSISENDQPSLGVSAFSSSQQITISEVKVGSKYSSMGYQPDSQEIYRSRSPQHLSQANTSESHWVTPIKNNTSLQGNSKSNTPPVRHHPFSRGSSTTRTALSPIQQQQRSTERFRSRSPVGLISQANISISLSSPMQHITNSENRSRSRSPPAQNHPSSHGATSSCSISSPIQWMKSLQRSPAGNRQHSRGRSSSRSVSSPILHKHGYQDRYRSRSPNTQHHQSYRRSPISRSPVSPIRHQRRFPSTSTPLGHRSHSWENSRFVYSPIHYQQRSQERFRSKSPPQQHQQRSPSSTISKVVIRDRFPMPDEKFQKRVLHGQCELKQLILRLGVSMDTVEENTIQRCSSLDDLRQMETSLQNPDDRCQLIAKCVRVGGVDVKDMVGNILDRLMTNEVMAEFNMKGQRGKLGFENTAIFKVVTAAVLKGHKATATEYETAKCIGRYLKYAPDRKKGGRKQQD